MDESVRTSATRRDLLKYAGVGAVGIPGMAGIAAHLHWNRSGVTEPAGTTGLFLTWQRDPTTTMTIDWHTRRADRVTPELEYSRTDASEWMPVKGDTRPFPFSPREIHRVELTDLEPGTEYSFRVPATGEQYRFRTMPASISPSEPLTFAAGGDTLHSWKYLHRMNQVVTGYDLDFIHWGGDLAYANGNPHNIAAWYYWFAVNKHTLVRDGDRIVPVVVGIGNHEVPRGYFHRYPDYEQTDTFRETIAPYFYDLFAFPGHPGYGSLDFGDYLRLVVLDSNHTNPIEGQQTAWLEDHLAERSGIDHRLVSYHVAGYPSHRNPDGRDQRAVRRHWTPLFDEYRPDLVLEHHDHTYNRTVPITNDEADPADGIIYVGDGSWGVSTRDGDYRDAWYVDEFSSVRQGLIATADGSSLSVRSVSEHGETIDAFEV